MHAPVREVMQTEGWNGFWDQQKDGMHAGACITGPAIPAEGRDSWDQRREEMHAQKGCMLEHASLTQQCRERDGIILGLTQGQDACWSMHHCGNNAKAGQDGGNASLQMIVPGEMQGGCMPENACRCP
jgi:hypothetical protein